MFIAALRISDSKVTGCQQSPTKPADTGATTFLQITEADYTLISELSHPAGGDLKWQWNGVVFVATTDPRRKIRVVATSATVVVGTSAQVTLSVLTAGGAVDTTFNGQVLVLVQAGDNRRIFRVTFVNGVKVVNVPTTALGRIIELLPSPLSLVEDSVPITLVTDV